MTRYCRIATALLIINATSFTAFAQFPRFKVLAFFSNKVERDHTDFSRDAIKFFKTLTKGNGFVFDTTSNMSDLNEQKLKDYSFI
ncbi:MAG TPA: hypothetical protein VGD31_02560, partial [Sphingobacteriaceae bacterium]